MCGGEPIDLKEEDSEIFSASVQWLYTHHIDSTFDTAKWSQAYVLGEKLMDREYLDCVIETMMRECTKRGEFPGKINLEIIYEGTPEGSPARKLLVDFVCWMGNEKWIHKGEMHQGFNEDLVLELMRHMNRKFESPAPWVSDPSAYFVGSRKKKSP